MALTSPPSSAEPARGFALVVALTLLSFLVLLCLSLSALTRVETQAASCARADILARQNAVTALHLALGELQSHAGPDPRITARADLVSSAAPSALTGVWDVSSPSSSTPSSATPRTWLISGSEDSALTPDALLDSLPDPTDDTPSTDTAILLGNASIAADPAAPTPAEKSRRLRLPKRNLPSPTPGQTPLGRYAWWIGDEGVKASLALPDRFDEVVYPPWSTTTQRQRLRQQLAGTPNYFRAATAATPHPLGGFDPLVSANLALLPRVETPAQLAFLAATTGDLASRLRAHHPDFTTVAHAVLANTRTDAHRGLQRDLALAPGELGPAFAAYSNYSAYMEAPGSTTPGADPAYPPINDTDSPRRRYRITPPTTAASAPGLPAISFGVAPVLTDFLLQFKIERPTTSAPHVQLKARLYVALWNPYTSSLAVSSNDNLQLAISGLPTVTITSTTGSAPADLQASLPSLLDAPTGELRVRLPFGEALTTRGSKADRSSWLPGRLYGWATASGANPPADLEFYEKNISAQGWPGALVPLGGSGNSLSVSTPSSISGITLRLLSGDTVLATYELPAFRAIDSPLNTSVWRFGFAARLKQPLLGDSDRTWLAATDPRAPALPSTSFTGFAPGESPPLDPNLYAGASAPVTARPEYLLYRIQGTTAPSLAAYNDVPLFELPRLPLLSVGELQHLPLASIRPFALGNSWGGSANALFDRFFFSGLPGTPDAAFGDPDLLSGQPLPNFHLRVLPASSAPTTAASLRSAGAFSSRHLLQAGAFNLNSTSPAAWRAFLSSTRLAQPLASADIENTSGDAFGTQKTAASLTSVAFSADSTLGNGTASPAFFRFPQSAQETFFWKPVSGSTPAQTRQFPTHAFRLGLRGAPELSTSTAPVASSVTAHPLTTDQIEALASEIVRLSRLRAATSGPFLTLEEFLGPLSGPGTPSLLETALANTALNPPEIQPLDNAPPLPTGGYGSGLSSLTLTQADLLSARASQLRTRSDTFVIRAYGETLNPTTGEPAATAFLEAIVQRFPETVDPADNIDQPAGTFGRRFKILSQRWLSPSDI